MATLYLDHDALELKTDGKAVALYRQGERVRTLPTSLLERVVIQGDVTLSAGVLGRLVEAGASVLFLSRRNSRRLASVVGPAHADARIRLAQYEAVRDATFRARAARGWLRLKLRGQRRLLLGQLPRRPDRRKPLLNAIRRLEQSLAELEAVSGRNRAGLMGLEGAAASAYFTAFATLFPPSLAFKGRNRRPPRDPVNAVLSLTYTMLHHEAVSELHAAGLDPWLGFLHAPAYGRESLACDLIEPLRPHADAWVLELFCARALRGEDFRQDKGRCLLGKAGRGRFYTHYAGFAAVQRRRLRRLCRLVVRALPECDDELFDDGFAQAALS